VRLDRSEVGASPTIGVRDDAGVEPTDVAIRDDVIRLGQLLQLGGIVDSGSDAKLVIGAGDVVVNGEVELRRGRQLHPGDVVEALGASVRVVAADPTR
jgi:ribosome-associated protein